MVVVTARFRILILAFGLACSISILLAQQGSKLSRVSQSNPDKSGPEFTIKSNVDRVVVDVVVNDKNGKPVRGLTKKDFSVYEDGKSQDILSFDMHDLNSNPGYFAKLPPLPPNTFVNIATEPEKGPLYVLLLDLLNTAPEDQPYARQQLLKFIESKPEGTRFVAFILGDSLYLVQGFTSDRNQLRAALDPSHPRPHVPRIFLFRQNFQVQMYSVFTAIALYLDGLPGRKNIIWYSAGFPLDLFPHKDDPPDKRARVTETLDALTRVDCAIYPVDVSGVQVYPAGRLTGGVPNGGSSSGAVDNIVPGGSQATLNPPGAWDNSGNTRGGPGGGPLIAQMAAAGLGSSPWDNYFVEDKVAKFTGGRAFYSRNDFADMLEDATEDGANYYTLTYSPSNRNFNGNMRNIVVRLEDAEKGIQLEYRRGYLATAPPSPMMPLYKSRKNDKEEEEDAAKLRPVGDPWSAYMERGAPIARQIYFRTHIRPLGKPQLATREQMANLVEQPTYFHFRQKKHSKKPVPPVRMQTYLIEYQIIGRVPHLEVAAGVYDEDNRLLNADVQEATSATGAPDSPKTDYTYFRVNQKIDVPVTAISLRLGVHDLATDRMGTMEIPLPLVPEPAGTTP